MGFYPRDLPDTLEVCGTCCALRGPFTYETDQLYSLVQCCRCDYEARLPGESGQKWPILEYNTAMELCRGCGAIPLRSGTRWSVWFCDRCKPRAIAINSQVGRPVLPIGRHSLMHGIGLGGADATSKVALDAFVSQCRGFFDQQDRLADWAREVVRRNLIDHDLDTRSAIPLPEYANVMLDVDFAQRFDEMLTWFTETGTE